MSSAALLVLLTTLAAPAAGPAEASTPAPALDLHELLEVRGGRVEVSEKVRALEGRRVRIRGWLVVFEEAPADAFWLAPRPVFQDESGGGSGDLPPLVVRVSAPAEVLAALPAASAPLEVVGRLEQGRQTDADGRISMLRIAVEDPRDVGRLVPAAPRDAGGR